VRVPSRFTVRQNGAPGAVTRSCLGVTSPEGIDTTGSWCWGTRANGRPCEHGRRDPFITPRCGPPTQLEGIGWSRSSQLNEWAVTPGSRRPIPQDPVIVVDARGGASGTVRAVALSAAAEVGCIAANAYRRSPPGCYASFASGPDLVNSINSRSVRMPSSKAPWPALARSIASRSFRRICHSGSA
jgi:hypothetical protein